MKTPYIDCTTILIRDSKGKVFGRLRVTPTDVYWSRKEAKTYRGCSMDAFAKWMQEQPIRLTRPVTT
jgi:hypothetical protein